MPAGSFGRLRQLQDDDSFFVGVPGLARRPPTATQLLTGGGNLLIVGDQGIEPCASRTRTGRSTDDLVSV